MFIEKAKVTYENEPLKSAFGFKGNALTYLQQTVVILESGEFKGVGLGVQSVLWSDVAVFKKYGEDEGNRLMYDLTRFAISKIEGREFSSPEAIIDEIFDDCYKYAKEITKLDVKKTFVLNALVPIDFAAWILYAKINGKECFDDIYPGVCKNSKLANIPLITYSTSLEEVVSMARAGTCIFKIKIGADPDKDGDPEKMIAWDKARALSIFNALKDITTEYTDSRRIVYYFDANGRYDTKERLGEFVDFLSANGILEHTVLFEEPFPEDKKIFIGDFPICFAADESAHSIEDVEERIALGYKAITLKPIAKTLSVTMKMAKYAYSKGVQCFCADLTVNPVMLEWNKNFAARTAPLSGMKIGVVESNGSQNYVNWEMMKGYLPISTDNGKGIIYELGDDFYSTSGGVFLNSEHYAALIDKKD